MDKSLTVMALVLCTLLTLTPTDHRLAVLTFAEGNGRLRLQPLVHTWSVLV